MRLRILQDCPIAGIGSVHTAKGVGVFVRTTTGQWNNLSRASAVSVEPDRHRSDHWVVLAHYSGRTVRLRSFPTETAAQAWVDQLLGDLA